MKKNTLTVKSGSIIGTDTCCQDIVILYKSKIIPNSYNLSEPRINP